MHRLTHGAGSDIAGDALYAALIYFLLAFALPRSPRALVAAGAIVFCTAIELFQLTGIPLTLAQSVPASALVFGSGFDQRDLLVYPLGALAAAVCDVVVSRAARAKEERETGAFPKEDARSD